MKDFPKITSALINLLNKTTKFEWTKKCEKAFKESRQHFTTTPILTLLVEGKQYTV